MQLYVSNLTFMSFMSEESIGEIDIKILNY